MSESRVTCVIPADHPALAGHFPGNPIVPGVLLLDLVRAAVVPAGAGLAGVETVKFQDVLRPDQPFEIVWTHEAGRIRFRCVAPGVIAAGVLQVAPA